MIKTPVGQEALGLFIFLKKMKPDVQKMLWMERYADYSLLLNPEVIFPRRSFYGILETLLPTDILLATGIVRSTIADKLCS